MRTRNRIIAGIAAAAITLPAAQLSAFVNADAAEGHLIINQVYGGNGKGDTPILNSFAELYNPTDSAIDLKGYKLVCGDKTLELKEDGVIPAGGSWLIVGAQEDTSAEFLTYELPEADQLWDAAIDNNGYVMELQYDSSIVDAVWAGAENDGKKISKQKSLRRTDFQDTDSNDDFEVIVWEKTAVDVNEEYVNLYAPRNSKGEAGSVYTAASEPDYTPVQASDEKVSGFNNGSGYLDAELYARYNSGALCADGGSLEIVEYNEANGYAYAVSGLKGKIVAAEIASVKNGNSVADIYGIEYDVKSLITGADGIEGFVYGDITSVAVSPDGSKLAACVQHEDYTKNGAVAIFDCGSDGSLLNPKLIEVGNQPDMVTFSDDNTVLTANEGEPRNGYENAEDPKGGVSIVKLDEMTSVQAGFEDYSAEELIAENIIVGKVNGEPLSPEYDLEPEYIAVSSDGKTAYVSLQEANAVAVLDIEQGRFTDICSVGYQDYSTVPVDIVEDGKYEAATYENLVGARMPDGISLYETDGKTFLITANEGDSRDWNGYCNELKTKAFTGKNIRILEPDLCAGLPEGKSVMFGGRSFTIFEVTPEGLCEVYDSADEFEKITAQYIPDYFNCSNDDADIDSRSGKKGPEPENVTIGKIGSKTYAFAAIERIGGIMIYDITDPSNTKFANYINSREFASAIQGDVSPEGLCFVSSNADGNAVLLAACEVSGTLAAYELSVNGGGIVILYTNDTHNAYENGEGVIGYAAAAQYKKELEAEGCDVILVDAGDAIQGSIIGTLSKGWYISQIMDKTGYEICVPGNHEFDFGMDNFLELAEDAQYDYVCCNFVDLRTGDTVFKPYEIKEQGGKKIAYIGITTPETYTKSTPTYFMDENGNYIYSFCEGGNGSELYNAVQNAIDSAKQEGAEYFVAVGHAGTDPSSTPWTSKEIIANTTGIDAFIDGHSHSVIESEICSDKDGNDVLLTSTGTKFNYLGEMTIDSDGEFSSRLISGLTEEDPETLEFVNGVTASFDELKNEVVAVSGTDLVIYDPEDGNRLVRSQETNLGDLCADAYREMLGADVAFVNGGGIRSNIEKGEITYGDIIDVHPYGNAGCLIEATGQQILDALELGSSAAGVGESGGFLQVSGLTYEINTQIPSSVVKDDMGMFVKVDGEYRVQNVTVGGEPLDLNKTYKLASHNYMLKSAGDGYTMFRDDKILLDEVMIDNQVLINYITEKLGGEIAEDSIYADPYGEGRIRVITDSKAASCTEDGYVEYVRGSGTVKETIAPTGHSYGEWTVTKEATADEYGEESRVCENCGEKETQLIPKTGNAGNNSENSSIPVTNSKPSNSSESSSSSSSSESSSKSDNSKTDSSSKTGNAASNDNPTTGTGEAALTAAALSLMCAVAVLRKRNKN